MTARSGPFERSPRDRRKVDLFGESEARFRALVQNSFDIITIHDASGVTVYESPAASRLLGYPSGMLIGKTPFETLHPKDVARARIAFDALLKGEVLTSPLILRFRHADGSWIYLEALGNNLLDHPGIRGIVLTSRDVTERKRAEERVRYLANYDALTGLPNRFLMQERMGQIIAHASRNQLRVALVHVDLDRFKEVNETWGSYAGDALLKQAADRIRQATQEAETVARVGGDEFTLVYPNVTSLQALSTTASLILDELARPFANDGQEVFVSASVGISLYPDDAASVDELIKHAGAAMSSAKQLARNSFQFYTSGLNQEAQDRMQIQTGLRTAIARGEMSLVFQPKIDLSTRQLSGAEALLRWNHPKLGSIAPSRFVPIAEEAGLIGQIGEWVFQTACRQIREWQDAGHQIQVAVNVSARQFHDYDLADLVTKILSSTGAKATNLEIELTESAVMRDAESSIVALEKLAAVGVQIAIDDFGTGYSSLSYLKRLPLDYLKIDQSFVRDITSDPNDAAIVRAIITLARSLGIKVIAEGVENEAQLAFLNAYGCQYAQGFLFGRPLTGLQLARMAATGELAQDAG